MIRARSRSVLIARPYIFGHVTAQALLPTPCRVFSTSVSLCATGFRRGQASRTGKKVIGENISVYWDKNIYGVLKDNGLHSDGWNLVDWFVADFRDLAVKDWGAKDALKMNQTRLIKLIEKYDDDTSLDEQSRLWIHDCKKLLELDFYSEVCYFIGHFLWNQTARPLLNQYQLARYFLSVSVEAGGQQAHLDLWLLAKVLGDEVSGMTYRAIKEAAESESDWRAMQLYVDGLLKKATSTAGDRQLAFELAVDLNKYVEPGAEKGIGTSTDDQMHSLNPLSHRTLYVRPWELLRDAAVAYANDNDEGSHEHYRAVKYHEQALRDGVEKYNSVDAMKDWADHEFVKIYSEQWIHLKTRAAMAGDVDSCSDLARYWLEKHGWYPCAGKAQDDQAGRAALSWMILAANLSVHDADKMGTRYLIVALVLRENGFKAEGLKWLRYGLETMEETCEDDRKKKYIATLESAEATWKSESYNIKAERLLGKPLLPEEMKS